MGQSSTHILAKSLGSAPESRVGSVSCCLDVWGSFYREFRDWFVIGRIWIRSIRLRNRRILQKGKGHSRTIIKSYQQDVFSNGIVPRYAKTVLFFFKINGTNAVLVRVYVRQQQQIRDESLDQEESGRNNGYKQGWRCHFRSWNPPQARFEHFKESRGW